MAYFELEKMRSMRFAQRHSDDLATSFQSSAKLIRSAKLCLFVKLRLSPGRIPPGIKISRVIVARAKSVKRLDGILQYQLRPLAVGKNTNSRLFVRSVPLFRSLMLTPMPLDLMQLDLWT